MSGVERVVSPGIFCVFDFRASPDLLGVAAAWVSFRIRSHSIARK